MKRFSEYIKESNGFIQDIKYSGKKSKVMKNITMTDTILKDFKETKSGIYKHNKEYNAKGAVWTLFYNKNYNSFWGLSGDYSFGKVPSYVNMKHYGNIQAAETVYTEFMKDYF